MNDEVLKNINQDSNPGGGSDRQLDNPRVEMKLRMFQYAHQRATPEVQPGPRLKVCPSCFAREDKPHRDKCMIKPPVDTIDAKAKQISDDTGMPIDQVKAMLLARRKK